MAVSSRRVASPRGRNVPQQSHQNANQGQGGGNLALDNMTTEPIIPQLGQILRAVIKSGGYRSHLVAIGLDKDLDDIALGAKTRQGSSADLVQKVEDACFGALSDDCGIEWAQFLRQEWSRTVESIQTLALQVDTCALPRDQGKELLFHHFSVPMLSGFLRLCIHFHRGPDTDLWWESPFQSWVSFAAKKANISEQELLDRFASEVDADQRTIERWLSGAPLGKIVAPIAPKVAAALAEPGGQSVSQSGIQNLTGWLVVASAFQSLPLATRDAIRRDFDRRQKSSWALSDAIAVMTRSDLQLVSPELGHSAESLFLSIQKLFENRPVKSAEIEQKLAAFQCFIDREQPVSRMVYQYGHDWLSARLAAFLGDKDKALGLYAAAVSSAWWRAGRKQQPLLNEALLYAVGVGDKVAAERYWDKTFLLGLNKRPKRPLDEQELRRIAFGFEAFFAPQKAKDRVPPPMEVILREEKFTIDSKHRSNPNRKVKHAGGRTRRTPLMEAILVGTLDDVKQLIAAGGDPNDFIKESGEGPLSYAMRRACDRKDPAIMDFLLGLDLQPETVNRPASSQRETPLKIGIEMAGASAVSRLIGLGADVEQACEQGASALCYALAVFHNSQPGNRHSQEVAYLAGQTRGDVVDAKGGAVLDVDLAARRQGFHAITQLSERHRQIFDEIRDYFTRPPEDHRDVIQALLMGSADANRRYRVSSDQIAEWTPTLYAAEIGDLEVFKILVEHPGPNRGDPTLCLMPPEGLQRYDALWVAIDHERHAIVDYLTDRERQQQSCR